MFLSGMPTGKQIRFPLFIVALTTLYGCNVTSSRLHQQTGNTYYRQGQLQLAQGEFQRALADDPQNATNAHNLAATLSKQGNLIGAEQMFQHALQLDANHQPAYHGLAQLMVAEGRQKEAFSLIKNWQAQSPQQAASYIEMAWLQNETGDVSGAEESLRTALIKQPNHPTAMSNLGQLFEKTGRLEEAKVMYQRSLSNNLHQPEVYRHLAVTQGYPQGRITGVSPTGGQALMNLPPSFSTSKSQIQSPRPQIQYPPTWPASPQAPPPPLYQPTGNRKPALFKTYSSTSPPPLVTSAPSKHSMPLSTQ